MAWTPAREAVGRQWRRRWVRRVTYTLVAGTSLMTIVPWVLTRPAVLHWGLGRLDALVTDETGLHLRIGQIELHPFRGSLTLQDIQLGEGLLHIERVEVVGDPWSLWTPTHHLISLRVVRPQVRLTEQTLAGLRLKPHPPRTTTLPQFRLDTLNLSQGQLEIPVSLRGLPPLQVQFDVKGKGLGPNHLQVTLPGGHVAVLGPGGWDKGRLDFHGEVAEPLLRVHEIYLRLAESQLRLSGSYEPATPGKADKLESQVTGALDLAQAARWGGLAHAPLRGRVEVTGSLKGPSNHPDWALEVQGSDLLPAFPGAQPGDLQGSLRGTGSALELDALHWTSSQGQLVARAKGADHKPITAQVQAFNLELAPFARILRAPQLNGVRGNFEAQFLGPTEQVPLKATLTGTFEQAGLPAGEVRASLAKGRLELGTLQLALNGLQLAGSGWATLGSRGILQAEGQGKLEVGVGSVAEALRAWRLVDLNMAGEATTEAHLQWTPRRGLGLEGTLSVSRPRWHGAEADLLTGQVSIQDAQLRVNDLSIQKDLGLGSGALWLTWAPVAPGEPQLDMCYSAFRLPVLEGLKAADLGDLPLQGQGSGWVRIHGPYEHLRLEGAALVEQGQAYGLTIPVASSDFLLDLASMRLRLDDLRVAEEVRLLGHGDAPAEGALALHGRADLDLNRWTWLVDLAGRVDSKLLNIPGPRIQARLDARLLGPITAPYGALDLPEGTLSLDQGRVFLGEHSVDGLRATATLEAGRFQSRVSFLGHEHPLLTLQANRKGLGLVGALNLEFSPDTAETRNLALSLSEDFLQDLGLKASVRGTWDGQGLAWEGSLEHLAAGFQAFELHQSGSSLIHGNAAGASVNLTLEGGQRGETPVPTAEVAQVRLSGTLPFLPQAPVALRAQGGISLSHLKSVLDRVMEVDEYSVLSQLSLEGESRFDLLAHGTYSEPLLDGTLSLQHGRVNLKGYQGAEDLTAEILLKDRTLSLSEARPAQGTLAHGQLQVSGLMAWKPGGLDTYDLRASLDHFQLRDVPAGLNLQGSLQANLSGEEGGGLLEGTLQADRLGYQSEVKLSDLILRSALSDGGGLSGLDLEDPLDAIALDLDLELREPWQFDTNLLKLEGQTEGPFKVLGTLGHPVPKGKLVFQPGGRITNIFPAGDMVVDRGELTFSESRPLDPLIGLQGSVSSIPGYTVNLDIHGTLSNLAIIPSSTPSLRQDEIVAILINPGNVANVGAYGTSSSTQGAITSGIASAGTGLISTLAFTPFQEQLRKALGLYRVNVAVRTTSLGTTETEFTLGKSLNLFGQRSALVFSHRKSGELTITSGQVEWRFGNFILQLGASKGGSEGLNPSGEFRHSWSPR